MAFLRSLDISASGLTAQRLRMDIISENLANANTTRTANGQPYQRKVVTLAEQGGMSFAAHLDQASAGGGVVASSIGRDTAPFIYEYDPGHPDSDADGYVRYPNVDEARELIDMMAVTRSYEANVTALNATKSMAMKALEIGT